MSDLFTKLSRVPTKWPTPLQMTRKDLLNRGSLDFGLKEAWTELLSRTAERPCPHPRGQARVLLLSLGHAYKTGERGQPARGTAHRPTH